MGFKLPPFFLLLSRRSLPLPWLSCYCSSSTAPWLRTSRSSYHQQKLIPALDREPESHSAVEFSRRVSSRKRFRETPEAYARAVLRLGLAGDTQRMEDHLKEMVAVDHPSMGEALGFVVSSFCSEGRVPDAFRVFKVACLEGRWLSISGCNDLLGTLVAEGGDLKSVVFVYKEMVKGGVVPDVDTLNCLIEALFQSGCVDSAMEQFRGMNKKGCAPNTRTLEIVMYKLCINGHIDEAVEVLDEMLGINCKPDNRLFNTIIPIFCKCNRFVEAMKLFQLMRDVGILLDSSVYATLICCLCENGELDVAAQVLEEMSEKGLTVEVNVYAYVVNGFCRLGKFGEAVIFLEKHDIFEVEPFNMLLQGYCSKGEFLHASNLLKKMLENDAADNLSWNILIRALCESQNVRKAFEVLSRMIVSSYLPDEGTFSAVISGYCKVGAYKNALEYFQHVHAQSWSLDYESRSTLIRDLCHIRKIEEATEIFYHVSGKGESLPTSILNLIISHICLKGLVSEAIRLRSISFCNGSPSSSITFNTIILRLLELNKLEYVRVLLSQMLVEDCPLDVETYCLLIRGLCTTSMTRDAWLLFDRMLHNGFTPDSDSVNVLLSCLAKCSQVHKVAQDLERAVVQGLVLNSAAYNTIICALLREGHNREACKFLDEMLEKGWIPDVETHGLLVGNVGGEGEHKSLEIFEMKTNDSVTSILAEGLATTNENVTEK